MKWRAGLGLLWLSVSGCVDLAAATSGQIGCKPSDIEISNDESGTGTRTWIATCHGVQYYCSSVLVTGTSGEVNCHSASSPSASNASAPAAASPPAEPKPVARAEPPGAVAGFSFTASVVDAEKACTDHGFDWESTTEDHYRCSNTPNSVGFDAVPTLRFCKERLCAVSLQVTSPEGFLIAFGRFNQALTKKYGMPRQTKGTLNNRCSTEAQFKTCVMSEGLELVRDWSWDSGARISLRVAAGESAPDLKVIYVRKVQQEVVTDAL
jgi:hypothetical protein